MSRFGFELRPPNVQLDADIRWVLLAAFADAGPGDARPALPERAARLIHRFSLVNQVASRLSAAQLAQALTPALQEQVSAVARSRVMRSLAVVEARERVCRAATEAGVDIVLLKQAALEVMGLVTPGQRFASDVNLLVDSAQIEKLSRALEASGCLKRPRRNPKYHPVVFATPSDISLELHIAIPCLRLNAQGEFLQLLDLKQHNLVQVTANSQANVFVPTRAVLAAHLVTHGLVQHRFTPQHHPAFRVVVDAQIVELHRECDANSDAYGFIRSVLARREFDALAELSQQLSAGNLDDLSPNAQVLANHVIASSTDADYRSLLMLQRQLQKIHDVGLVNWTIGQAKRGFFPTDEELNILVQSRMAANWGDAKRLTPVILTSQLGRALARVTWRSISRVWRDSIRPP